MFVVGGTSDNVFMGSVRPGGMQLIHRPDGGDPTVFAQDVDVAWTRWQRARGLMFRRTIPDGSALVLPFGEVGRQAIHTLFVPIALDVVWVRDQTVTKCRRMRPWLDVAWGEADTVIELVAGDAEGIEVGDDLYLVTDIDESA